MVMVMARMENPMASSDAMFPDMLEQTVGNPIESERMPYDAFATAIHTMTRLAAACALAGDLPMGRAFVRASNELVQFAMERWPTVPSKSVEEQVHAAAVQLRYDNQPPKQEVEPHIVRIVLIADADESRAIQVNGSTEYVLVKAGTEHELHVDSNNTLTVTISPGNRYSPPVEDANETGTQNEVVDDKAAQEVEGKTA